jgi:hypothetical protein
MISPFAHMGNQKTDAGVVPHGGFLSRCARVWAPDALEVVGEDRTITFLSGDTRSVVAQALRAAKARMSL